MKIFSQDIMFLLDFWYKLFMIRFVLFMYSIVSGSAYIATFESHDPVLLLFVLKVHLRKLSRNKIHFWHAVVFYIYLDHVFPYLVDIGQSFVILKKQLAHTDQHWIIVESIWLKFWRILNALTNEAIYIFFIFR